MSDYFVVSEIIKFFNLDKIFIYYRPFVFWMKVKTGDLSDSYFITIFGASDITNKESLNIQGFISEIRKRYALQTNLNDCINNEKSLYFNLVEQLLYIHFEHELNPYSDYTEFGKTFGFTNDKVRNFNGIKYLPEIISIPDFSEAVDPLQYERIGFRGGNTIYNNLPSENNTGKFDNNEKWFGNEQNILFGKNNDDYFDLLKIQKLYIESNSINFNTTIFSCKDLREQQSINIPIDVFNISEYPDIEDDLIDTIIPEAYGLINRIPGICINGKSAGNKFFYFASNMNSGNIIEAKKNEVWVIVTPVNITNGTVELSIVDAHIDGDNTKGLNDVRASGEFINIKNPADIIVELNKRYLDIDYNLSNYDIAEWEDEKQYLADVGLYLDDQKDIFEWIEILQYGSTVGFQYFINYGKRTIRLDNPNRPVTKRVKSVEILNDIEIDNNAELFSTHAIINYDNKRLENRDYYDDVFMQHRKENKFEIDTLLINESDAYDKSVIIMEDQKEVRFITDIEIFGKEYFNLKIFDILDVELSQKGEKIDNEIVDLIIEFSNEIDLDIIEFSNENNLNVWEFTNFTKRDIIINERNFLGWNRMQLIGKKPDFDKAIITLSLRQRDYSEKFAEITGYPY